MKKAAAFLVGLVLIPTLLVLGLSVLVPLTAVVCWGLAIGIGVPLIKWLVGKKPVPVLTESGTTAPPRDELITYRYEQLGIKLCFAAGLLTSFLLFTVSDGNPEGTWLVMFWYFVPIYIIAVAFIIITLFVVQRILQLPPWILKDETTHQPGAKQLLLIRITSTVVVIAIASVIVIPIAVNTQAAQRTAREAKAEGNKRAKEKANAQAAEEEARQLKLDARAAKHKESAERIAKELAAAQLSAQWSRVTLSTSPQIHFEYPTAWDKASISVSADPYKPGSESNKIEFSASQTPDLYVWKGFRGSNVTYGSVEGYGIQIAKTDYQLDIILYTSDFPDLCNANHTDLNHLHCHAGKFAADFKKLVDSVKAE